jgi:hypothetical protein
MNFDERIAELEKEKKELAERYLTLTGQIQGLDKLDLADKEREERLGGLKSQQDATLKRLLDVNDDQRGLRALAGAPTPEVTYQEKTPSESPYKVEVSVEIEKPSASPPGRIEKNADELSLAQRLLQGKVSGDELNDEIRRKSAEHYQGSVEKDSSDALSHAKIEHKKLEQVDAFGAFAIGVLSAAVVAKEAWDRSHKHNEHESKPPPETIEVDLREKSSQPQVDRNRDAVPQQEQSPQEMLERAKLEDLIKRGQEAFEKRYEDVSREERENVEKRFQEKFDEMRKELDEKWAKTRDDEEARRRERDDHER